MNALAARRRHPAALVILILIGLIATGGLYAVLAPKPAQAQAGATPEDVQVGRQLFLSNCATCHGKSAGGVTKVGPSLIGVGAASVDFQVGTGRMPLAAPGVQAPRKDPAFTTEQTSQMAAYVASLAPGPAIPEETYTEGVGGNQANGAEIFRVNCSMCHNYAGSGGALSRGKYAPQVRGVEGRYIYMAMLTGPQSMPVFNDQNLTPRDKNDVIAFIKALDESENRGGHSLGNFGPVGEGFFLWGIGIFLVLAAAVWLGRKAA
ncbi:MAG TPA: cytochrome c [Dermatophilaceae bacterium]|nr:cytochrome c [Dermatophilaceae bacterium]